METIELALEDEKDNPSPIDFATAPASLSAGHEGRLKAELRAVVGNPLAALADATARALDRSKPIAEDVMARAFAELAVTGEQSYSLFRALDRATHADAIVGLAQIRHAGFSPSPEARAAASEAFLYADDVGLALRAKTQVERAALRARVSSWASGRPRYVAVSGEDDLPDRPVNQSCSAHIVDDIWVPVAGKSNTKPKIRVRFARTQSFNDVDAPLVIYLHGLGSRLEEGDTVLGHLEAKGYAGVAMDLPNQGYSQRISFDAAGFGNRVPNDGTKISGPFLALDWYGRFLRSFVTTLAARFPANRVEQRIALVCGGSQGGTLSLRIGFRAPPPWLPRVAAWSPGSAWMSFHQDPDFAHWVALNEGPIKQLTRVEDETAREDYISGIFDRVLPGVGKVSETWWRRTKNFEKRMRRHVAGARAGRHEVYDQWHRRWCSAMEQEQLAHSFRGKDDDPNWKFTRIEVPTLLIAGDEDDFPFANIFSACRTLAKRAREKGTPDGSWVELTETGHSVHDERPALLANLLHGHIVGAM